MEGERHLLSNHADIEATINNAIEHFLYEESFREEQKNLLESRSPRPGRFRDSSNGLWEGIGLLASRFTRLSSLRRS